MRHLPHILSVTWVVEFSGKNQLGLDFYKKISRKTIMFWLGFHWFHMGCQPSSESFWFFSFNSISLWQPFLLFITFLITLIFDTLCLLNWCPIFDGMCESHWESNKKKYTDLFSKNLLPVETYHEKSTTQVTLIFLPHS